MKRKKGNKSSAVYEVLNQWRGLIQFAFYEFVLL